MEPGWESILPPLIAIVLAVITRQVLVSLFTGAWVGIVMIGAMDPAKGWNVFESTLRTFDTYLVREFVNADHAKIMIFTSALGGMVGIMVHSGGSRGLANAIAKLARGRRGAQFATGLLGCVVFFDDYANCLIVGNTMRPYTDRLRISREKLSFLVDATAAPVATVALATTWIGYQATLIQDAGLAGAGGGYAYFLGTLPYSYYSWATLAVVFTVALSLRDFGPMLKAERRALATGDVFRKDAQPLVGKELEEREGVKPSPFIGIAGVVSVVALLLAGLVATGMASAGKGASIAAIIQASNPYDTLMWGAFGAAAITGIFAVALRRLNIQQTLDAFVDGCKGMLLALMVLLLAWMLSGVCKESGLGAWAAQAIHGSEGIKPYIPVLTFALAAVVSFATGTSWGTMGVVMPAVGGIIPALFPEGGSITYATVGAVLTGSVWGDHCSPISDTTVMSSVASGSDHIDHVKTQLPYAALGGVGAALAFLAVGFGAPWWLGMAAALAVSVGGFWVLGRRVETPESAPA